MPDIEKEKSFRIAPNYINVYYNLGNLIKLDSNRLEEAIKVRFYNAKPDLLDCSIRVTQ